MPSTRLIKTDFSGLAAAVDFVPPLDCDFIEIQITSTITTDNLSITGGKKGLGAVLAKYASGNATPALRVVNNEHTRDGFRISGGSSSDTAEVNYYKYDPVADDTIVALLTAIMKRLGGKLKIEKDAVGRLPPRDDDDEFIEVMPTEEDLAPDPLPRDE